MTTSEDARWFVHPDGPRRMWFLFALRDELPLGTAGWSVWRHEARCGPGPDGIACQDEGGPCWAARVQLIPFEFEDERAELGMADLAKVIDALAAKSSVTKFPDLPGQTNRRWVAAVSVVADSEGPLTQALDLTHDALAALRLATNSDIPGFSIERVWPTYLIACSEPDGAVSVNNLVIVEHGRFGPLPEATDDQLSRASIVLMHRWRRSPIETYNDFAHAARTSLWSAGDYTKAVTSAAVACEILIKHTAWMLTFEATEAATDPHPEAATTGLGALKPSQLMGQVLTKRLGGNWSTDDTSKPIGAWRHHVARLRAQVLHRGHRPNEYEAGRAVEAIGSLERHVCDRLAARVGIYPKTAWALAGPAALDRRGALAGVENALAGPAFNDLDWLAAYVVHLDTTLDDADD